MKRYSHVAVIGIDGMGNFNSKAPTPCMDRIFANGACTYGAMSMDPTISAENWGGMLTGAEPAVHGLTNGYVSVHPYNNPELPGLFSRIREAYPDDYLASVVNWNPINIGIAEDGLGVDKRTAGSDEEVTRLILECVEKKPAFLFVQLDEVDGAGHHYGYGTEGHLAKIAETDALVGKIYEKYESEGIAGDTLFICIADHGGNNHSHGGWSETEKYVFLAAAGRDVPKGRIPFAVTKDISAIVLYALGIEVPAYTPGGYTSQVPEGIFEGAGKGYIMPRAKEPVKQKETPAFGSPGGLGSLFGDRLKLCMFFDNSPADEIGKCAVKESGNVKFYSNGVRSGAAEFGATGAYEISGLDLSRSFTLAFWVLADADLKDNICILGNRSPEREIYQEKGFNILLRNHSVMAQFGCGDDDTDSVTPFGTDGFRGWVHILITFDYEKCETGYYLDFVHSHTDRTEERFMNSIPRGKSFAVGDDCLMNYNRSRGLIFRMDDLMVFDGVLTDDDIAKLKEYYK